METRDGGSRLEPASLPCSYVPLPDDAEAAVVGRGRRTGPLLAALLLALAAVLLAVATLAGVILVGQLPATGVVMPNQPATVDEAMSTTSSSRGPESGVSEKTSGIPAEHGGMLGADAAGSNAFPWSNAMLQWQRTGFHFQPEKNWMNDPNGNGHISFRR
jgi:beta-fructofuranosidase